MTAGGGVDSDGRLLAMNVNCPAIKRHFPVLFDTDTDPDPAF